LCGLVCKDKRGDIGETGELGQTGELEPD